MRLCLFTLFVILVSLFGCQGASELPYTSEAMEGPGRFIHVDYSIVGTKVQVVVDTSGFRVQKAYITRTNNQKINPQSIQQPRDGANLHLGFGSTYIGAGRNASGSLGAVSAGNAVQQKTYLWFEYPALGDPPWKLTLHLQGIDQNVQITLPDKASSPEVSEPQDAEQPITPPGDR